MSDIEVDWETRESEVTRVVDALLEEAEGNDPAAFLVSLEDDLSELRDVYGLTDEELSALGGHVAERLGVSAVCGTDEHGFRVQFFVEPSNARRA